MWCPRLNHTFLYLILTNLQFIQIDPTFPCSQSHQMHFCILSNLVCCDFVLVSGSVDCFVITPSPRLPIGRTRGGL
ncbi:hypothetical protein LY78DRAFT_228274 [Colletotrichum sublineola]|nr:hypothetical protein LY78DRAFT_228274 [Colletotrichum sublineola]